MLIHEKGTFSDKQVNIPKSVDHIIKSMGIERHPNNLELILAQFGNYSELVRYKVLELLEENNDESS